jgi:lysophospholipase L1-like esterase
MRRLTFVLGVALAALGTASLGASAKRASPLRLTLPPVCYAVAGLPMSIYYDNIVLTEKPDDYRFAVRCDLGAAEDRRWTVTPGAGDVGDHPLSITVSHRNGRVVERGKLILRVAPADAGAGRSVRLLIVGDSLTHATAYPNEIARLLSQPGNPTWTMLGTHRPPFAAKGVGHEGYGGWTWETFASHYVATPDPSKNIRSSPFVFAIDGKGDGKPDGKPALDLPRYFQSSCDGRPPDFVTFLLGINDCFSAKPDDPAAIDARIDAMFVHADKLIAAFRRASPKAELGICLTTPPNARESGFEAYYHGAYHRWGWKTIQHRLVQRELEHFGGRQGERIFAVPTELNLDPVDGYPVDNAAHPNDAGYRQIGVSIYAWIKSRLAASQP